MMQFFKYIIFFSFLVIRFLNAQQTVAVLDFEARGIEPFEAETLTERLRSEIPKTETFRLVDRKFFL